MLDRLPRVKPLILQFEFRFQEVGQVTGREMWGVIVLVACFPLFFLLVHYG